MGRGYSIIGAMLLTTGIATAQTTQFSIAAARTTMREHAAAPFTGLNVTGTIEKLLGKLKHEEIPNILPLVTRDPFLELDRPNEAPTLLEIVDRAMDAHHTDLALMQRRIEQEGLEHTLLAELEQDNPWQYAVRLPSYGSLVNIRLGYTRVSSKAKHAPTVEAEVVVFDLYREREPPIHYRVIRPMTGRDPALRENDRTYGWKPVYGEIAILQGSLDGTSWQELPSPFLEELRKKDPEDARREFAKKRAQELRSDPIPPRDR